jgi:hypothetical protein
LGNVFSRLNVFFLPVEEFVLKTVFFPYIFSYATAPLLPCDSLYVAAACPPAYT